MSKKFHLQLITVTTLFILVLFSGCSDVSEIGSKIANQAGIISSDQADSITRGSKAVEKTRQELTPEQEHYIGRAVAAKIFQRYRALDRPEANAYLNLLGQSLAIFSDRPETFGGYHFMLLDSDEVNAFAAPGGLILVTRGMLRCCENEDELAAVLAHEICHVELKHGLRSIKQGRLTAAFTIIAAESAKQLGSEDLAKLTREFEASVGDVVMTLTTSGYSRTQERDADAAAVRLLSRAGYPEAAMITMLRRMDERLADAGGLGFAKTHPSAKSRENSLRSTVSGTTFVPDTARRERYSTAMRLIMAGS
jgi:predicted Zn-dependent protease